MTDVARRAKVSLKTVSRVLNREPHVQERLRQKVMQAVDELGYVPSVFARSLRSNRSYTIHLFGITRRSNFMSSVQFGASCLCQEEGYALMISLVSKKDGESADSFRRWLQSVCRQGRPDGVILLPPLSNVDFINLILTDFEIPVVRVGAAAINDKNWTVRIHDEQAANRATQHLIELGHSKIAFIKGKPDQIAAFERFDGYCRAMNEAGIGVCDDYVVEGDFAFQSGRDCARSLLQLKDRPTAIFASNDDMAAGVLVAAHTLGLRLPDELSVIGFDDTEMADKTWPALSTIRQPINELGERAAQSLIEHATVQENAVGQDIYLEFELVVRESTARPHPKA